MNLIQPQTDENEGNIGVRNIQNIPEGMWGRRKRGGGEGEGELFYPLQHPKDRSINQKDRGWWWRS